MLHRYAHIPSSLVLNKVDLVPTRSDLFRLTEILTDGIVDGHPIPRKKVSHFGRLGALQSDEQKRGITSEMRLHQTDGIQNKDEQWHRTYGRLLRIPTHKASWTDTKSLFINHCGWPNFKSVFYTSTKTMEGVDSLRKYLREVATPALFWLYDEESMTTKTPHQVCEEHVRSALMNISPPDISYKLNPKVVDWQLEDEDSGPLLITVDVNCDRERLARHVMRLANSVEDTTKFHLQQLFKMPVEFRLNVRFRGKLMVGVVEDRPAAE